MTLIQVSFLLCAHCMNDARLMLCCCAGRDPVPQQLPVLQHLGSLQRMADVGLVFQFPERHFLGATVGQVSLLLSRQAAPAVLLLRAYGATTCCLVVCPGCIDKLAHNLQDEVACYALYDVCFVRGFVTCLMTQAGAGMAWQMTARARSRLRGEGSCHRWSDRLHWSPADIQTQVCCAAFPREPAFAQQWSDSANQAAAVPSTHMPDHCADCLLAGELVWQIAVHTVNCSLLPSSKQGHLAVSVSFGGSACLQSFVSRCCFTSPPACRRCPVHANCCPLPICRSCRLAGLSTMWSDSSCQCALTVCWQQLA